MPMNNRNRSVTDAAMLEQPRSNDDRSLMAYSQRVRACQLDRSLASLKRLDLLLSQIRHELLEREITETAFLSQPSDRRFLLFVGRYAGQILAQQWQQQAQWLTAQEINEIIEASTPNLDQHSQVNDGFYHQLACQYRNLEDPSDGFESVIEMTSVFFPLEVLGARLFASLNRPFISLTGEPVETGLYQAVRKRLPAAISDEEEGSSADLAKQKAALEIALAIAKNKSLQQQKASQDKPGDQTGGALSAGQAEAPAGNEALAAPILTSESLPSLAIDQPFETKTVIQEADRLVLLHTELLKELHALPQPQSGGEEEYQKAVKILEVFEGFVAAQKKPRCEVKLSESHSALREEAVALLTQSADQGNTAAMLHLAMQKMLGEGTDKDLAGGVSWVQKAAHLNDSRAQRLLSKLYYQGLGLDQDLTLGKHWLEQAAKNGHPDAQNLVSQWQQVAALTSVQKQEQLANKRYLILFIGLLVLVVLLVVMV